MAEVADAALRVAGLGPAERHFEVEARRAYLLTLFRARRAHSPAGMVRAIEGFERIGDSEMAARARRIADSI